KRQFQLIFFFSSRRRHTRSDRDWSSDVCSSDLAFDPKPEKAGETSFLKTVWKYDCNPPERKKFKYPAAEGPSEINATPVTYKNRVYVAVGQDPEHGEGVGVLSCIDPTKTGDITQTGKIWTNDKVHRSL